MHTHLLFYVPTCLLTCGSTTRCLLHGSHTTMPQRRQWWRAHACGMYGVRYGQACHAPNARARYSQGGAHWPLLTMAILPMPAAVKWKVDYGYTCYGHTCYGCTYYVLCLLRVRVEGRLPSEVRTATRARRRRLVEGHPARRLLGSGARGLYA